MHYSAFDSNGQCTSAISFKTADVHFAEKCFGPLSFRKVAPSILSFRRTRIISVTIRRLDPSIHAVDDQFCFLVLTDFSTCIHSLLLCFIMTARSLSTATFDIPSGIRLVGEILSGASAGDRRSQKCAGRVRISWRKAADAERADGRIDDDMRLEALKQTNYIKAIVTAKGKMDAIGNQSDRK